MGRKAIVRERKPLNDKARSWVRDVVPLLQDQALDKLTLDQLAELMGKSKSTIYSYFSTKEEIYQTAVQLVLDSLVDTISPEAIEGENMEVVLEQMLMTISKGIEGISIHFLEQIQKHFPDVWLIIEGFTDLLIANFKEIYSRGMRAGTFRPYNLELLLALDKHFVMSIMTDASKFEEQGLTLNQLVKDYIELRLFALRKT